MGSQRPRGGKTTEVDPGQDVVTTMGRAHKGLIITTRTFTRNAIAEATRDGDTPIDLIDGPELMDRLKDLGLVVTVSKRGVEDVEIKPEWFQSI